MEKIRIVIVSNIKGEAGKFNKTIRDEVYKKFHKRSSTLPAHFTIKSPIDISIEELREIENTLHNVSKNIKKNKMIINGYGNFREDVIYMKIIESKEARETHNIIIDELLKLPFIHFKKNEGKNNIFHCTITSKNVRDKFKQIMDFVHLKPCYFECNFDNVSIYNWNFESFKWEELIEYRFEQ